MTSIPQVSVLLTVYNGQAYLGEAIDSILGQTFTDFEFIIINDGSTDDSHKIIQSYKDPRITYIKQTNHGLIYSLNKGLQMAKADLIARMDADDISEPARLASQVAFMNSHPQHVLVGSNLVFINELGKTVLDSPLLLNDAELRLEMLIRSPFGHPAIMYRKAAVINAGLYDPAYKSAEDYDLWIRLGQVGKLANDNKVLLRYRVFSDDASTTNRREQLVHTTEIRNKLWGDGKGLPLVPRLGSVLKDYTGKDQTTKIQIGRLADVYIAVWFEAVRRHYLRYAGKVMLAVALSPTSYMHIAKGLKRKVWK